MDSDAAGLRVCPKGAAERVRDADHRNRDELAQLTREGVFAAVGPFIHDDDADSAGCDGVLDLGLELAGPASDQRDRAALEILKVACLAPARRRGRRLCIKLEIYGAQPRGDVAGAGVGERANRAGRCRLLRAVRRVHGQDGWRPLLEKRKFKLLKANLIAGLRELLRYVLG